MRETRVMPSSALVQFFSRLVRRCLYELWIDDQEIADYLAHMLARFARTEQLYPLGQISQQRLESVVQMLLELSQERAAGLSSVERERELVRHIGDYTLFMSGIFRAFVERRRFLDFYVSEGERAYRKTAELDRLMYRAGARRFDTLAAGFDKYSDALDYMRRVYFPREAGTAKGDVALESINRWIM